MTKPYFEKTFEIRAYECDFRGRLSPLAVFNFMQDLASQHADLLGFSVQKLMQQNMTWVLSRIHLQFTGILHWGDEMRGRTWPSGTQGRYALRDFQLFNGKGKSIAVGTSSWMVLDLEKRKPVKFEDLFDTRPFLNSVRALSDEFLPLPEIEGFDLEKEFQVRYSDLDVNQHVNHVAYIDWGLESIPESVLLKAYPVKIEVGYRREVFYGDQVFSRAKQAEKGVEPIFHHQIFSGKDDVEIARMRTKWK